MFLFTLGAATWNTSTVAVVAIIAIAVCVIVAIIRNVPLTIRSKSTEIMVGPKPSQKKVKAFPTSGPRIG